MTPHNLEIGPDGCVVASQQFLQLQAYRDSLSEDTCCSFKEWSEAGYHILPGAKSMFKDALGVPQFTLEQVAVRRW